MPTELTGPVGADEFIRSLKKCPSLSSGNAPQKIAVAVSGGPDSMAMAFCAKRWNPKTIAFIVDHGLRPESETEAEQVKIRLEKIGIEAEILRWVHQGVTARLHEQARAARYDLLLDACRRHDIQHLLVAHHREDQAETILMRLAKGSGIEGLAGIARQSLREDIHILRPFLALSKERLIATCEAAQIPFVTDPSNKSEKFARGRLRKIMPLLADEGLSVESLLMLGTRASEAAETIDFYAKNFLTTAAECEIGGSVRILRAPLCALPRAVALRVLTFCLRTVHDGGHPPEYVALSALLDRISDASVETAQTLYGCIISIATEKLSILREPSAAVEITSLIAGQTILWDERWLVTAKTVLPQSVIRALGNPPHEVVDRLAPKLRHLVPQGRVRASLPTLWVADRLEAIPSFEENAPFRMIYQKQSFP